MLIVSKFRDFYDSVAFQKGVDKTLVYKREEKELRFDPDNKVKNTKMLYNLSGEKSFPTYETTSWRYWSSRRTKDDFKLETFVIGFCGKIYPVCERTDVIKNEIGNLEDVVSYIYGIDNIQDQFKNIYKSDTWTKSRLSAQLSYLRDFCNRKDVLELFYIHKCPIFAIDIDLELMIENKNLILNPSLKDFEFYKCMDTYQVFQELEMYIGGVIGSNGKDTVEVSDESKIVGKGFDLKTSFRKEPGTKKRGKTNN